MHTYFYKHIYIHTYIHISLTKQTDKSRFIALHATIYNVLRCVHLYAEFAHTQSTDVTAAFKSPLESNGTHNTYIHY